MLDYINCKLLMAYTWVQSALAKVREDEGGMEVIQVVMLLGIGIVVVLLLSQFGSQITTAVGNQVSKVVDAIGGGS